MGWRADWEGGEGREEGERTGEEGDEPWCSVVSEDGMGRKQRDGNRVMSKRRATGGGGVEEGGGGVM